MERAEGLQWREAATSWAHWRQAQWDALLLTGMAGVATSMARKEGWESLLQDLEQARAREDRDPVLWAIERQWERVGPRVRWEITRLLWRTLRGGPMGAMLAGAIWKPWPVAWVASLTGRLRHREAQRAQGRLEKLAQTGLVEEVTLHPAEWWRETTMRTWRVAPMPMWDVLDGWMKAGANLSLLLILLWVVWLAVLFVYPLWACVLYGVPDRALERVVQAALRVSRHLRQLGWLREREEWLRKAWEHWRGEESAESDNPAQQGKN